LSAQVNFSDPWEKYFNIIAILVIAT